MNKKIAVKKPINHKNIIFWSVIGLITLAFITIVVVRFIGSRTVNNYDSIEHLVGQEVFEQKEETYVVYLYSKDPLYSEAVKAMDEVIFNYVTFQKRNSDDGDVYKLYAVDLANPENAKAVVYESELNMLSGNKFANLKVSDKSLPVMVVVKEGTIIFYSITENDISNYLQKIIEDNK